MPKAQQDAAMTVGVEALPGLGCKPLIVSSSVNVRADRSLIAFRVPARFALKGSNRRAHPHRRLARPIDAPRAGLNHGRVELII
jgi:hypothetical protein